VSDLLIFASSIKVAVFNPCWSKIFLLVKRNLTRNFRRVVMVDRKKALRVPRELLTTKRTAWTAFVVSMLCVTFVVERHAWLHTVSQKPTMLYAPEMFDSESTSLNGGDYEWPYIWDAGSKLDPSGYDWLGATYEGSPHGLAMPPSHDVFGELQDNGPQDQRVEYDEVVPLGSLPDQFVQERSASNTMLRILPTKFAERPQARLEQASSPSAQRTFHWSNTARGDSNGALSAAMLPCWR
jgi:hypothetical protein